MRIFKPRNADFFYFEEIGVNKEHSGLDVRESEGSSYVNFSNVVRITQSHFDADYGIEPGDVVIVHHRASDNKLAVTPEEYIMICYTEDIIAIHRDKGESPLTIDNFIPVDGYRLTQETYKQTTNGEDLNTISDTYSLDIHTGELIEYRKNADYEIFFGADRFFAIKKEDEVNDDTTVLVQDDMLYIDTRVFTDREGGKRLFNEDLLGYVYK